MSACAFANDASPVGQPASAQVSGLLDTGHEADELARIPAIIAMGEQVNVLFDSVYSGILAGRTPHHALINNPFSMMADIFGRALREIRAYKGTGELGPDGDKLITVLAESRHKADRNANLIRQMLVEPKPYVSSIDRNGLVALAKLSREAAASYNS